MMMGRRNVWMNVSQEGKDDLDDLREKGALNGLKLQSDTFQVFLRRNSSCSALMLPLLTPCG